MLTILLGVFLLCGLEEAFQRLEQWVFKVEESFFGSFVQLAFGYEYTITTNTSVFSSFPKHSLSQHLELTMVFVTKGMIGLSLDSLKWFAR